MDDFRIRLISEADVDGIIVAAGGQRAHDDPRRAQRGADYRLGEAIIELKVLDDDGFAKPERQAKLAALFRSRAGGRPVVVLDPALLPPEDQRTYTNIIEGPILGAARSAKGQLVQSRLEHPDTTLSVLMLLNNGYTALNNQQLCELAARRARQYPEIDGVIVGGCYFYGDGFDNFFLWPLEYLPIRLERPFPSFDLFREAWNDHATMIMTKLMTELPTAQATKGPVIDSEFTVDGVTYVKPTPPMGRPSEFYGPKRPRRNSTGIEECPPVALVFPDISQAEWPQFQAVIDDDWELGESFEEWIAKRAKAQASGTLLQPLVCMPVTFDGWQTACAAADLPSTMRTLRRYATDEFQAAIQGRLAATRERTPEGILAVRYVLAFTEEIGQDKANDVSGIYSVRERPEGKPAVRVLADNVRIFHEHAVALAAAYAISEGVEAVLWQKDLEHAWT